MHCQNYDAKRGFLPIKFEKMAHLKNTIFMYPYRYLKLYYKIFNQVGNMPRLFESENLNVVGLPFCIYLRMFLLENNLKSHSFSRYLNLRRNI